MPSLATSTQHTTESTSQNNCTRKKMLCKSEKKVKVPLSEDNMILYIENPKESIKNFWNQ